MPGSGESLPPNNQGSADNGGCVPNILPDSSVIQRSVPVHGITQLGLRSHPTGSTTHEAHTTTFSFLRADKPVYTTMSVRPFSPCQPTQAMAGPIVSHIRNSYPAFPGRIHDFHLYPGLGCPQGGFPDFGCLDPFRTQAPHQCAAAQGNNIVMIATDNTTVVAYINKHGGLTHSHALLQLVVDLFLWLQTQDIAIRARHIPGCLNGIADRLSQPDQPITTE